MLRTFLATSAFISLFSLAGVSLCDGFFALCGQEHNCVLMPHVEALIKDVAATGLLSSMDLTLRENSHWMAMAGVVFTILLAVKTVRGNSVPAPVGIPDRMHVEAYDPGDETDDDSVPVLTPEEEAYLAEEIDFSDSLPVQQAAAELVARDFGAPVNVWQPETGWIPCAPCSPISPPAASQQEEPLCNCGVEYTTPCTWTMTVGPAYDKLFQDHMFHDLPANPESVNFFLKPQQQEAIKADDIHKLAHKLDQTYYGLGTTPKILSNKVEQRPEPKLIQPQEVIDRLARIEEKLSHPLIAAYAPPPPDEPEPEAATPHIPSDLALTLLLQLKNQEHRFCRHQDPQYVNDEGIDGGSEDDDRCWKTEYQFASCPQIIFNVNHAEEFQDRELRDIRYYGSSIRNCLNVDDWNLLEAEVLSRAETVEAVLLAGLPQSVFSCLKKSQETNTRNAA